MIADHDPKGGKGEAAARETANRWQEAGRETHILIPREPGDLNDIYRGLA